MLLSDGARYFVQSSCEMSSLIRRSRGCINAFHTSLRSHRRIREVRAISYFYDFPGYVECYVLFECNIMEVSEHCQRTINAEWQLLVPIHLELPETLHYNLSDYGDWNEQFQVSESIMFAIHDNINHSVILVIHSSSTRRYKELYSFVHMRKFTVSSSNCKLLNRRILT
jgi:hypothetical protein